MKDNKQSIVLGILIFIMLIVIAGLVWYIANDNSFIIKGKNIGEVVENNQTNKRLDTNKEIELTTSNTEKYTKMLDRDFDFLIEMFNKYGLNNYTMSNYAIIIQDPNKEEYIENTTLTNLEDDYFTLAKFDYVKKCVRETFEKELTVENLIFNGDKVEISYEYSNSGDIGTPYRPTKVTLDQKTGIYTMFLNAYKITWSDALELKDSDVVGKYEFKFKETIDNKQVIISLKKI